MLARDRGRAVAILFALVPLLLFYATDVIGAKLVGSTGWATDSTVRWGIVGTQGGTTGNGDSFNTLYASKPEAAFGTAESAFWRASALAGRFFRGRSSWARSLLLFSTRSSSSARFRT